MSGERMSVDAEHQIAQARRIKALEAECSRLRARLYLAENEVQNLRQRQVQQRAAVAKITEGWRELAEGQGSDARAAALVPGAAVEGQEPPRPPPQSLNRGSSG